MSALAFLSKFSIREAGHLGDGMIAAVLSKDPVTGAQVDIDEQRKHCHDIALRLSQAEQEEETTHKIMDDLGKHLNDTKQAAQMLGDRLEAAQTAGTSIDALNTQLTILLNQITALGGNEGDGSVSGTYFTAVQKHAHAEQAMHEWQQTHAAAVANLTQMENALQQAQDDLRDAKEAEARAKADQAQAERDAGLKDAATSSNIALNAMQKAAEEAKSRARAATLTADAIKQTTHSNADDIVAQTLAQATPTMSALDRLKALKK